MNVGKLRQVISDFGSIFAAAGATTQAEDLRAVAELMKGQEDQPVESFLSTVKADISPLDVDQLIDLHVECLRAAGTDEGAFRRAYDHLSKDKSIKKAEADRIAHRYVGGRDKWPSKKEALGAIQKVFVARRYDESKMKEVERSRPW